MPPVLFAFVLTTFAGLSTGIGAALALATRRTNPRFLAGALGFSAGVMIYVSLVELLPQAHDALAEKLGGAAVWGMIAAFAAGIALIGIIDRLVPEDVNPHEVHTDAEQAAAARKRRLQRTGVLTALAIGLHNFPEGFATFISALYDPNVAIPIAIAIAIHNIPEGIAVAVPIYHATGRRRLAFRWSLVSGMAEPIGAVMGYLLLMPFLTPVVFGVNLALVAGIMVFISLDELLPTAHEHGEHHTTVYAMMAGMIVMAASLALLKG